MELARVDVRLRNLRSRCTARVSVNCFEAIPLCEKRYRIVSGPPRKAVILAQDNFVQPEVAESLGLKSSDSNLDGLVPISFVLEYYIFSVRVIKIKILVWVFAAHTPIDTTPWLWAVHGWRPGRGSFDQTLVIRGKWKAIAESHHGLPNELAFKEPRECLMLYDAVSKFGTLGVVMETQPVPQLGFIKDLDVFVDVLNKDFKGGFVQVRDPNNVDHWGVISSLDPAVLTVYCDAIYGADKRWCYKHRDNSPRISLPGTHWHEGNEPADFDGTVVYVDDGTILHTYYFDGQVYQSSRSRAEVPSDWKDGYYSTRFYPRGHPRVPSEILSTFESQKPDWFPEIKL